MYVSSVFILLAVCCLQKSAAGNYRGRGVAPKGASGSGTGSSSGGMTSGGGTGSSSGGMTSGGGTGSSSGGMTSGGTGSIPGGMNPVGTGSAPGGIIPGGIGNCLAIVPFHRQLADFALLQMGTGYVLREILGVRTSVVAGIMYHMELYVATTLTPVTSCMHCDVKVVHQAWMPKKMVLHTYQCRDTCCRGIIGSPPVDNSYKS